MLNSCSANNSAHAHESARTRAPPIASQDNGLRPHDRGFDRAVATPHRAVATPHNRAVATPHGADDDDYRAVATPYRAVATPHDRAVATPSAISTPHDRGAATSHSGSWRRHLSELGSAEPSSAESRLRDHPSASGAGSGGSGSGTVDSCRTRSGEVRPCGPPRPGCASARPDGAQQRAELGGSVRHGVRFPATRGCEYGCSTGKRDEQARVPRTRTRDAADADRPPRRSPRGC